MQPAKELQAAHPLIVEAVTLFNRLEEIQQEIARRAYELFESRGYEHGRDVDDWTQAEAELLAPVTVEGNEADDRLEITAEVPGFNENDLEVAVEPRRLFLSGKKEQTIAPETGDAEVSGRQAVMFFRAIDLPAEIDTSKAEAHFKDGRLRLTLPKLTAQADAEPEPAREIPVE